MLFGLLEHVRQTRFHVPKITFIVTAAFSIGLEIQGVRARVCSKNGRIRASGNSWVKFQKGESRQLSVDAPQQQSNGCPVDRKGPILAGKSRSVACDIRVEEWRRCRFSKQQDKIWFVRLRREYQNWTDAGGPFTIDQRVEGTSLTVGFAW